MPGSHRNGLMPHSSIKMTENHFPGLKIEELDNSRGVSVSMKAGQILVFSSLLAHRSGPNHTERDRLAMAFALHKKGFREINVPKNLDPVEGLTL